MSTPRTCVTRCSQPVLPKVNTGNGFESALAVEGESLCQVRESERSSSARCYCSSLLHPVGRKLPAVATGKQWHSWSSRSNSCSNKTTTCWSESKFWKASRRQLGPVQGPHLLYRLPGRSRRNQFRHKPCPRHPRHSATGTMCMACSGAASEKWITKFSTSASQSWAPVVLSLGRRETSTRRLWSVPHFKTYCQSQRAFRDYFRGRQRPELQRRSAPHAAQVRL